MPVCRPCRKTIHTLSGRLTLIFIAFSIIIAIIIASAMGWAFRDHFESSIRPHLLQYINYLEADLGTPPQQIKAEAISERLGIHIHFLSAQQQWSTLGRPISLNELPALREVEHAGVRYGFAHTREREYLVSQHPDYTLAFTTQRQQNAGLRHAALLLILLLALGLLYYVIHRLFRPIQVLEDGLLRIGEGDLSHRLTLQRCDELGGLANAINHTAEELEKMLEAKRQLLLAISHELRSPLTRAKVAAEMIDDAHQRNEINLDLNEMEHMISELLESERLNSSHGALHYRQCQLETLIKELMTEHFTERPAVIELTPASITAELDPVRIKLLIKNLLDNAWQQTSDNETAPNLSIRAKAQQLHIEVRDHGPGIADEHLSRVTEAFYRSDSARSRAKQNNGGFGLGLYLCKRIAEAHGGTLNIANHAQGGCVVSVDIPLTAQANKI